MFGHVVRHRLRQVNKLGSHSTTACSTASIPLRSISMTAVPLSLPQRRPEESEYHDYMAPIPQYPSRRQKIIIPAIATVPEPSVEAKPKRRRGSHVDDLLRTPAYAGLTPPDDILKLLRERLYRGAAFYFLSQEALRANTQLLSLIQETIYLDMLALTSGKPHNLAIRLGWTYAGATRGPSLEALHQKLVVQQGRLPSIKEVSRAVVEDNFDPHVPSESTAGQNCDIDGASGSRTKADSTSVHKTRQDWTHYYNEQLHQQILEGAVARQTRKDGQKVLRPCRPSPGLHQLATMLRRIQELKRDRGFQPDWVTVNIVIKAWLRGLAAGPQKSPSGVGDIFHAFKNVLTMDVIQQQNLDFDQVVHPLGKMLVKALKNNGEWLKAREVLAWMAEIRQRIAANVESP
jgi:hypothetical protein